SAQVSSCIKATLQQIPTPHTAVPPERRKASWQSVHAPLPFDVEHCLRVGAPFAYRLAKSRGCKQPCILALARFKSPEHEIIIPPRCFVRGFCNKHHRAIADSDAILHTTTR